MAEFETVLPAANASGWERAVEQTSGERWLPIDVDIVRRAKDPWNAPEHLLPYLAHERSVDIWDETWSTIRKRSVIASAPEHHRRKGTAFVLRDYARFVDARITDILRPPHKMFSGPSLARKDREAWIATLPQVRTWRMRESGQRGFAIFAGAAIFASFLEGVFPVPSSAIQRLNRRARWVVAGVETDMHVSDFGSFFRLHRDGRAGLGAYCNRITAQAFFMASNARERLVTIRPTPRLAWRFPVGPTLEPVTAEPERVVEEGGLDHGAFCGRFMRDGYLRPSSAGYRIYWRFAVNDGSRANRRPSVSYMGAGRFGFPAHTAHLQVSVPGRRSRWAAGEGVPIPGTRFWLRHNARPVLALREAMVAARRLSDVIFIRFTPRLRLLAGRLFLADIDDFIVGKTN